MATDILEINQQLLKSRSVRCLSLGEMLSNTRHNVPQKWPLVFQAPLSLKSLSHIGWLTSAFVRECKWVTWHSEILLILTNKGDKVSAGFSLCSSSEVCFSDFPQGVRFVMLRCNFYSSMLVWCVQMYIKRLLSKKRNHLPKHSGQESQITEISTQRAAQRAFSQLFPNIIFSSRVRM